MTATMNTLWDCKPGKTLSIDGVQRKLVSRRACYGRTLQLTLDAPLPGRSSRLYDVDESNVHTVKIVRPLCACSIDTWGLSGAELEQARNAQRENWRTLAASFKPGELRRLAVERLGDAAVDAASATSDQWLAAAQSVYSARADRSGRYYGTDRDW